MYPLPFTYNDGGRAAAGYRGSTGDCAVRAFAIAMGLPYQQVYDELAAINAGLRVTRRRARGRVAGHQSVAHGVYTKCAAFRQWVSDKGWEFVPTMSIGSGCTHHMRVGEVPANRPVVLNVSRHVCAVVGGVVHDTHDPARDGTRCVYGYWQRKGAY